MILHHWTAKEIAESTRSGLDTRRDFIKKLGVAGGVLLGSGLWAPRDAQAGSVIKARTISSVVDNRISLANSNFARPIPGISGWATLRIGLRLDMNNTAANITGTPRFSVGFCSGTTNLLLDATTDHFVGIQSNNATWRYVVSTMTQYDNTVAGLDMIPFKRVGSTRTASTVTAGLFMQADPTVARRKMYFVDLIHGSPNYTFKAFYCSASSTNDCLTADFLNNMNLVTPSFSNHTYGTVGGTLAVDEGTNGTLNAASVAWDQPTPAIEICDIAVAKVA
jgi:hypothetical protein